MHVTLEKDRHKLVGEEVALFETVRSSLLKFSQLRPKLVYCDPKTAIFCYLMCT